MKHDTDASQTKKNTRNTVSTIFDELFSTLNHDLTTCSVQLADLEIAIDKDSDQLPQV